MSHSNSKRHSTQRVTKKMLAVEMYQKGMNVLVIAELLLRTEPSYVANALIERGYAPKLRRSLYLDGTAERVRHAV